MGSDASWWKVEGGGIGRGTEPEPPGQTGQAGRAGLPLLLLQWRSRGWGASPGGLNAQGGHSRGKEDGPSVTTAAASVVRG